MRSRLFHRLFLLMRVGPSASYVGIGKVLVGAEVLTAIGRQFKILIHPHVNLFAYIFLGINHYYSTPAGNALHVVIFVRRAC